jgi:hypothetical protein
MKAMIFFVLLCQSVSLFGQDKGQRKEALVQSLKKKSFEERVDFYVAKGNESYTRKVKKMSSVSALLSIVLAEEIAIKYRSEASLTAASLNAAHSVESLFKNEMGDSFALGKIDIPYCLSGETFSYDRFALVVYDGAKKTPGRKKQKVIAFSLNEQRFVSLSMEAYSSITSHKDGCEDRAEVISYFFDSIY